MKNIITLFAFAITLFATTSCSKDNDIIPANNNTSYTVLLKVISKSDPVKPNTVINYNDENSIEQLISTGSFEKSFTVKKGYTAFLRAKGTIINGSLKYQLLITQGDNVIKDISTELNGTDLNFDINKSYTIN